MIAGQISTQLIIASRRDPTSTVIDLIYHALHYKYGKRSYSRRGRMLYDQKGGMSWKPSDSDILNALITYNQKDIVRDSRPVDQGAETG
jgi:hypothetical protein